MTTHASGNRPASESSPAGDAASPGDSTSNFSTNAPTQAAIPVAEPAPPPPPSLEVHVSIGEATQLGRYRVEKLLGKGGMGSVYLARDTDLNRPVALKIPNFRDSSSQELVERFFREARLAATLNHPNICPIYDVGESSGVRYMAMGYVEGRPLSEYIKPGKPQVERQAAAVVRKLAIALQEAHDKGIVHRDLKPANIMIDRRNEPILMDFGLARNVEDETQSRLTQEGLTVGTPAYMSPEQVEGRKDLGPPADIFSLGVILYELLTSTQPFRGPIIGIITQILHSEPTPIREVRPEVSPEMAAICAKAMAKSPAQRFASMREFAAALGGFLRGQTGTSSTTAELAPATKSWKTVARGAKSSTGGPGSSPGETEWDAVLADDDAENPPTALPRRLPRRGQNASARKDEKKQSPLVLIGAGAAAGILAVVILGSLIGGRHHPAAPVVQPPGNGGENLATSQTLPQSSMVSESPAGRAVEEASPEPVVIADSESQPGSKSEVDPPGPRPDPPPVRPMPTAADGTPNPSPGNASETPPAGKPAGPPPSEPPDGGPRPSDGNNPPNRPGPPGEPPPGQPPRLLPGGPGPGGPDIKKEFERFDMDGDGVIGEDELAPHVFARADANHDGKITPKELDAAYKKYREKLHGPPFPGEKPPGRPKRGPGR